MIREIGEGFFAGLGFKDISEVRGTIKLLAEILRKKDILKATFNMGKIIKISRRYPDIEEFLIEKGIMKKAA